jgi:hypothetical protein
MEVMKNQESEVKTRPTGACTSKGARDGNKCARRGRRNLKWNEGNALK